jgi:hypothetical protein
MINGARGQEVARGSVMVVGACGRRGSVVVTGVQYRAVRTGAQDRVGCVGAQDRVTRVGHARGTWFDHVGSVGLHTGWST